MSDLQERENLAQPGAPELDAIIDSKYRVAFGVVSDTYGINQARVADLLYDAVYNPSEVVARHSIESSDKFPDRLPALEATLPINDGTRPDRATFTDAIRRAVTSEVDHTACLYPGALTLVETMAEKGPTAIWTQGDMHGQAPGAPGSYEQIKKVAGAGIGQIRHNILLGRAVLPHEGNGRSLRNVLTVVAAEDKFSDASIQQVVNYFERNGVSHVTILEDRLSNLQTIQSILEGKGFATQGIWVRQGRHGKQDLPFDEAKVRAVASLEEANRAIEQSPNGDGHIADFDDVLSDQKKRIRLQVAAVQDTLHRNGWL